MEKFWVREMVDGVLRAGGEIVKRGLKDEEISNPDIFFDPGTGIDEIVKYLKDKGLKL